MQRGLPPSRRPNTAIDIIKLTGTELCFDLLQNLLRGTCTVCLLENEETKGSYTAKYVYCR